MSAFQGDTFQIGFSITVDPNAAACAKAFLINILEYSVGSSFPPLHLDLSEVIPATVRDKPNRADRQYSGYPKRRWLLLFQVQGAARRKECHRRRTLQHNWWDWQRDRSVHHEKG
jgi:hypothetical protein